MDTGTMDEDVHYQLLRLLEQEPQLSQRELAERLGISLGKANYCLRALIDKGWVKMGNFYRSRRKQAYLYKLTPRGLIQKAGMAIRFLKRKEAEHRALLSEIEMLRQEVKAMGGVSGRGGK
jgi:EPS-associated MarR family transcriptional regulator